MVNFLNVYDLFFSGQKKLVNHILVEICAIFFGQLKSIPISLFCKINKLKFS